MTEVMEAFRLKETNPFFKDLSKELFSHDFKVVISYGPSRICDVIREILRTLRFGKIKATPRN